LFYRFSRRVKHHPYRSPRHKQLYSPKRELVAVCPRNCHSLPRSRPLPWTLMSIMKRKKEGKLQGRCNSSVTNLTNLCSTSFSQKRKLPSGGEHYSPLKVSKCNMQIKPQAATKQQATSKQQKRTSRKRKVLL